MGSFLKHFTADNRRKPVRGGGYRAEAGGFTLLEVLIALFLFAVMISFVYFTFISTDKGRVYSLRSAKPYAVSQTVFRILHDKLVSFNYVYPVFIATFKKSNGQRLPRIYFSGLSNTPVPFFKKESAPCLNYFYLKKMGGANKNKYYELAYKESYFKSAKSGDGSVKTGYKKIIIARNIAFLSVKYFVNNIWANKYNYFSFNAPPRAIKIKLGIAPAADSRNKAVKIFNYQFNM